MTLLIPHECLDPWEDWAPSGLLDDTNTEEYFNSKLQPASPILSETLHLLPQGSLAHVSVGFTLGYNWVNIS